jgi:hypothetical protein
MYVFESLIIVSAHLGEVGFSDEYDLYSMEDSSPLHILFLGFSINRSIRMLDARCVVVFGYSRNLREKVNNGLLLR